MNNDKKKLARLLRGAAKCVNDPEYADFMLLNEFDENYYCEGKIVIGNTEHAIESLWTGKNIKDEPALMLHITDEEFEGDIEYNSISADNQRRVIAMLRKHYNIETPQNNEKD